jgi:perosamine synthetase
LLARKLALAARYDAALSDAGVELHRATRPEYQHSYWMYSVLVPSGMRDGVMADLREAGIETRPLFYPAHTMPMYSQRYERHRVAEDLGWRGINLPSWPDLLPEQVRHVAESLAESVAMRAK